MRVTLSSPLASAPCNDGADDQRTAGSFLVQERGTPPRYSRRPGCPATMRQDPSRAPAGHTAAAFWTLIMPRDPRARPTPDATPCLDRRPSQRPHRAAAAARGAD